MHPLPSSSALRPRIFSIPVFVFFFVLFCFDGGEGWWDENRSTTRKTVFDKKNEVAWVVPIPTECNEPRASHDTR